MSVRLEAIEQITRIIAEREGGFLFKYDSLLTQNNHPQVKRWVATTEEILDYLRGFLYDRCLVFQDLDKDGENNKAALAIAASQTELESFPTWDDIQQWVEELYLCWGVTRSERLTFEQYQLDPVTALEDRLSHRQLQSFHYQLSETVENSVFAPQNDKNKLANAIVEMLNPYPKAIALNLYFKFDPKRAVGVCVGGESGDHWASNHKGDYTFTERVLIPVGFNPLGKTTLEIAERARVYKNPLLEEVEQVTIEPAEKKGQVALGHKNALVKSLTLPEPVAAEPVAEVAPEDKPGDANLYFDSNDICLGFWTSWYTGLTDYRGLYAYGLVKNLVINSTTNPTGKHISEICSKEEIEHPKRDRSPKHTHYSELTRAEKKLVDVFSGREIEFERFRVIKRELATPGIDIKVGNLISSQPDIKAWYVTGGNKGQDKAALYFTAWDGWEIGCREGQDELTGVFEDWSVIQHLDDNGITVNGIAAGDWHNQRCEKAEAEAIELQKKERQPKVKSSFPDIEWINIPR